MAVILVTGGASGIGANVAQYFLARHHHVIVLDQDPCPELMKKTHENKALFLKVDVRDPTAVEAAVALAIARWGSIDTVVTSAGIYDSNSIADMTPTAWQDIIQTNCYGIVTTVQAVLPHLKKSALPSIILIASDQVFRTKSHSFAYSVSKAAVAQMAKSMALDLASFGIRVNAVCPGTIRTPMTEAFVAEWASQAFENDVEFVWKKIATEYPLGRVGTPQDVTPLIYFLSTAEAGFITGAVIPVDGGLVL